MITQKTLYERKIEFIQSNIFEVAESESKVRVEPLGHNLFLTSKTCFAALISSKHNYAAQVLNKNQRCVFYYHKWTWVFTEFLESSASQKTPYQKIKKIFWDAHWLQKFWKNSCSFTVVKYTSVNFFRTFGAELHLK